MTQTPDPQDILSLLHTALYDRGGEMIEGGFVDHWMPNAIVALDDLAERFRAQGVPDIALDWLLMAIRAGHAPSESVTRLLRFLGRAFTPIRDMVREMLQDSVPQARAVAVRAGVELFDPSVIEPLFADESPLVRAAVVSHLRNAQPLFIRALDDPDPTVRIAALRQVRFTSTPAGGEALAARYRSEPQAQVRTALLLAVAEATRTASISDGRPGRPSLRERVGEPLVEVLLDGLSHSESRVRKQVAEAIRHLHGADVARALLARLRVERDAEVRSTLVRWPNRNFYLVPDEAVPLFASLLANDPDLSMRVAVADQMASLGPEAAPPLLAALNDPSSGVQMAAARALQGAGVLRHLPDLLHHFALALAPAIETAIEQAIQMIVYRAAKRATPPPPESGAVVQELIDALDPDHVSQWHIRYCKEELNALPLYSTRALYLWALHPNGEIFLIDMDTALLRTNPETDPLIRFAVVLHGARRYPELRDLIPSPPLHAAPCTACRGVGTLSGSDGEPCASCGDLGWRVTR